MLGNPGDVFLLRPKTEILRNRKNSRRKLCQLRESTCIRLGGGGTFPIMPKSLRGRHSPTLMISEAENEILGHEIGILLWRPNSLQRGGFIERVQAVLTINRPLCEECAVIKFEWAQT
ncbi:hypothetical protein CDAR_448611 [Caerostris darwini]|uniref:Uncharacterized protein n=1 Tax=Caerostris darwini TaxID=1538125 RepID=A0AAV4QP91_9ARAC|nr:hypothetical protein CDAR_448611 [Caerostris darwini]